MPVTFMVLRLHLWLRGMIRAMVTNLVAQVRMVRVAVSEGVRIMVRVGVWGKFSVLRLTH